MMDPLKKQTIFDILNLSLFGKKQVEKQRYYACSYTNILLGIECIETVNNLDGCIQIPKDVPRGQEAAYLASMMKVSVKILK